MKWINATKRYVRHLIVVPFSETREAKQLTVRIKRNMTTFEIITIRVEYFLGSRDYKVIDGSS